MWQRKQLKKQARFALRENYWRAVMVSFLLAMIVGSYNMVTPNTIVTDGFALRLRNNNFDIVHAFVEGFVEDYNRDPATRGILAGVFNSATQSGSFIFGVLNAVNRFVFENRILSGIILLVGAFLIFLYWMLIANPLQVGQARFFLESRRYPETPVRRVLFLFQIGKLWHVAGVMFFRSLYTVLWFFTIVGGFYKVYAWRMVPYLLAENPGLSRSDALLLSRDMMRGHKWASFKLDMSFLGWKLLSIITLGVLNILYTDPYIKAADAELYVQLRELARQNGTPRSRFFTDAYLTDGADMDGRPLQMYPMQYFPCAELDKRRWLGADYNRRYSLTNLVLLFFSFMGIGWLWEVSVELFGHGEFVNRGTLHGPWLPIYGVGGVLALLLLSRWRERPILTFFLAMAMCGVVEYTAAWGLETLTGARWWEYDDFLLNLHGRICLEALLVFGLGCCLGIYLLAPVLDDLYNRVSPRKRSVAAAALAALFCIDLVWSFFSPNTAGHIPADYMERVAAGLRLFGP